MSFILQSVVFPSYDLCGEESLYFKMNDRCALQSLGRSKVLMQQGGRLFTNTYFNTVSIGKWKSYTGLTDLTLNLSFQGRVVLKWWWYRSEERHLVIGESILSCDDASYPVSVPVPQYERLTDGVVGFELFALENSEIFDFDYRTTMQPRRQVRLGIVITHFNREQYVVPAVRRLNQQLLTDPSYADRVRLFVIDNSQNLTNAQMAGAKVIPNANLGGSGGFMRGLIHIQDSGEFTHGLFMDDDASNEIEAIRRTISLLEYAIDEKTAVSGAMLFEQYPAIQHENGAWFNGICCPRNSGFDMSELGNIVENEKLVQVDYGGWWFFAFPLKYVRHYTFPFFVRGDDIYFSLKNHFDIATLNGICSWQEDFAIKDGPLTSYLDTRGYLVHNLLGTFSGSRRGKSLRMIRNWFRRYALTYHYESANAVLDAVEDVMEGPDFWLENIDMRKRRSEILSCVKNEKLQDVSTDWNLEFRQVKKSPKKQLSRRLTLNGHLLPKMFFKKYNVALPKGFGGRINESFRCNKILCVDSLSQKGYVVEHDKRAFFSALRRYYKIRYRWWRNYDRLKVAYQARERELTSRDFWLKQFETHNK